MKYLAMLFLLISGAAYSQSKSAEAFRAKYQDDRDASVISLNGSLFNLFSNIAEAADEDDEEMQAMARITKDIRSMKIISLPVYKSGLEPSEIAQLRKDLMNEKYDELITMRDGRDQVYLLAQGDEKEVRNLYILVQEEEDFTMVAIDGVIKMEDISYLARHHRDLVND